MCGERHRVSMASPQSPSFLHLHLLISPEVQWPPYSRDFYGGFISIAWLANSLASPLRLVHLLLPPRGPHGVEVSNVVQGQEWARLLIQVLPGSQGRGRSVCWAPNNLHTTEAHFGVTGSELPHNEASFEPLYDATSDTAHCSFKTNYSLL